MEYNKEKTVELKEVLPDLKSMESSVMESPSPVKSVGSKFNHL